jgi:DNA repair exonuclease SbcCD nuclease subunit
MKIVHLSDTHLGYAGQGPQRLVEAPGQPGVLIRRQAADILEAFVAAIDMIITNICPDLVIHSGDVFDNARPTPQTLDFAMRQLKRLSDAGIPVVLIEGNHSYPRDRTHGSVLRLMSYLPGVSIVCDSVEQLGFGNVQIHALPHRAVIAGYGPEIDALDRSAMNVLIAHGVADGVDFFRSGRPAADVAVRDLAYRYTYIALGHCHRFTQVAETRCAFYSGSLAMVTWRDFRPGHQFGINIVTINDAGIIVTRALLPTRAMQPYGLDDARDLAPHEVLELLNRQVAAIPPDNAYCQVIVEGLDPLTRRTLAMRDVEELFERADGTFISLRAREQRWEVLREGIANGGDPFTRFTRLASQLEVDATVIADVQVLGHNLLSQALSQIDADDLNQSAATQEESVA